MDPRRDRGRKPTCSLVSRGSLHRVFAILRESKHVEHNLACRFDSHAVGSDTNMAAQSKLGIRAEWRHGCPRLHSARPIADRAFAFLT
jgi:hypothetical protein